MRQAIGRSGNCTLEHVAGAWSVLTSDGTRYPLCPRGETPPGTEGFEVPRNEFNALPELPLSDLRWVTSKGPDSPETVLADLEGRFTLRIADPEAGTPGMRMPQAGAVHAVLAHWSTGNVEPATVVLPTGTGKTETMLALFAQERLARLLILVPSDRLRTQIAEKFETYGVLPEVGVLRGICRGPTVGRIEHRFSSTAAVKSFADRCNVIVATPSALNASSTAVVGALVDRCSHLFVDEAHHVTAATWARIRNRFERKPVVQFTATPFREDGQRLGGRIIYSFPLSRARELGYFQPISYVSVLALAEPDRAVAEAAIAQLKADREDGLDHLIMARVNKIARARDDVIPIYEELAPEFAPSMLHSDLPSTERRLALEAIKSRASRIIVCVDMLGEGFDFPELKIAALHDPHRSLGPTLQFIGRFARSRADLGTATAVVARPDAGYDERLRSLYAEQNQWNAVIETLAGDAIEEVQALDEFEEGFNKSETEGLSIQILKPKMSAVVYSTSCQNWRPERLTSLFRADDIISPLSVNPTERVAWLVVSNHSSVRWAELQSLQDVAHHLHVLHWDSTRSLLYINTSQLESLHEDVAKAVCGDDVQRVQGETVYRVMGDLQRPVPTNVGVIDLRNRSRRFSMHVGSDVYEGFPVADQQSKSNTNIFVVAYENGERMTLGAARKGRIWSQQAAQSVLDWVRWCQRIGPRLQNDALVLDGLFRSFVRPEPLNERPALVPLGIDWAWLAYAGMTDSVRLSINGTEGLLIDSDLVLTNHEASGPISFQVRLAEEALDYEAEVRDGALVHRPLGAEAVILRERSDPIALSAYLNGDGTPTLWFEQEVVIDGSVIYRILRDQTPIDSARLVVLAWDGVDIRRESQGSDRDSTTVQARAAEHLMSLRDWDVVLDDDDTGEIADLVALAEDGDRVVIHLVHCKFSSEDTPGARVADLYEVCGQAQRSTHHRQNVDAMIRNLIRRERHRRSLGRSGLLIGDDQALLRFEDIVRRCRPDMRITIAQPGLSKAAARTNQYTLLGATDKYVLEVAHGSFDAWVSA